MRSPAKLTSPVPTPSPFAMHPATRAFAAVLLLLPACASAHGGHDHLHSHPRPELVALDGAREIDFPGHRMRVLLEAEALEGDLAVFELTVPPKSLGAPPHVHSREDESFFVLEGELVFLSGEEEIRAAAGTTANLPRGHLHGFWNAGDTPARALLTITPAGFAPFFDEVVAELRARGLSAPHEIGALLTEVAARYGCEIDGARIGPIVERYGLR